MVCTDCETDKPASEFYTNNKQCKPCARLRSKLRYQANKEKLAKFHYLRRMGYKLEAFEAYGGIRCVCCKEEHPDFLVLDHVDGGGTAHRENRAGAEFYRHLKNLGYPQEPRLQVMCFNCNAAKEYARGCPHEGRPWVLTLWQHQTRQLKQQIMSVYGTECACCNETQLEFLSIDHINNDGAAHRREINGDKPRASGTKLYKWLKQNGFPQDLGLQTLCHNCNSGKTRQKGVCPHHAR